MSLPVGQMAIVMVMPPLLGLVTIVGTVNWLKIVLHLLFFYSAAMNILFSAVVDIYTCFRPFFF